MNQVEILRTGHEACVQALLRQAATGTAKAPEQLLQEFAEKIRCHKWRDA